MSIVSNTGPLIALAKADKLPLLELLFGQVYIPPSVHRELMAKYGLEAARIDQVLTTFLKVSEHPEIKPEVKAVTLTLDQGEQDAIALAYQMGLPLMIDERLGRQSAHFLDISVTGVVGVLIYAKQQKHIESVRSLLEQIRSNGYWLSDELIINAAKIAGER